MTWQKLVLVCAILAAIVCAGIWAPGVVQALVGIAGVVVAFLTKSPLEDPKP